MLVWKGRERFGELSWRLERHRMLGWCAKPTEACECRVGADDYTYGGMGFRGNACDCQTREPCADSIIPV
jgi:hypothetical protein